MTTIVPVVHKKAPIVTVLAAIITESVPNVIGVGPVWKRVSYRTAWVPKLVKYYAPYHLNMQSVPESQSEELLSEYEW